jgi:hypothetical protein
LLFRNTVDQKQKGQLKLIIGDGGEKERASTVFILSLLSSFDPLSDKHIGLQSELKITIKIMMHMSKKTKIKKISNL